MQNRETRDGARKPQRVELGAGETSTEGTTKTTCATSSSVPRAQSPLQPTNSATRRRRAESERRTACWESLWELWAGPSVTFDPGPRFVSVFLSSGPSPQIRGTDLPYLHLALRAAPPSGSGNFAPATLRLGDDSGPVGP